jgi:uncharacterized membrane protein
MNDDHTPITRITFKFNRDPWQQDNFENQSSYLFQIGKEIKAAFHAHKTYTTANNKILSLPSKYPIFQCNK